MRARGLAATETHHTPSTQDSGTISSESQARGSALVSYSTVGIEVVQHPLPTPIIAREVSNLLDLEA